MFVTPYGIAELVKDDGVYLEFEYLNNGKWIVEKGIADSLVYESTLSMEQTGLLDPEVFSEMLRSE